MAEQKTATFRTAKRTSGEASGTFTDEEKAAARERVKELKRSPRASKADGARDVLDKISEMDDADRMMAERIHASGQLTRGRRPTAAGRTHGADARWRASSEMRRRLALTRHVSASILRKRGTTLVTSQRQRSSKRVIRGHAGARRACGIPRLSE
jgi:hypothetical protein